MDRTTRFGIRPIREMSGCPICLSGYEKTVHCSKCNGEHLEDELYCGICEDCLRDAITYDTMLDYLVETDGALVHFLFHHYYKSGVPEQISESLFTALRGWFLFLRVEDTLAGKNEFLLSCEKYVMDADGEYGRTDFAEWLNGRNA